jgi:hypothetical protein
MGQTEKYSARAIVFRSSPKADMPAVGSSFQIQHYANRFSTVLGRLGHSATLRFPSPLIGLEVPD